MSYQSLLSIRETEVDGVGNWTWVASDDGAWDGPHKEWLKTHRDAYLNNTKGRDIVVQAGGNCGLYPRLFAQHFKMVYTFEPDPLNFHCLVNNCQLDNVVKINGALGKDNSMVRMKRISMSNVGMHQVVTDGECLVPQFTIDQLNLPACDLIQLDVESYESAVLFGAIKTIEKYKPTISCEHGSAGGVVELLAPLGYNAVATIGADTVFVVQ